MGGSNSTSKEEGMSATQELYHLSDEARLESVERDLETLEEVQKRVSTAIRWDFEDSVMLHSAVNMLHNHAEILRSNVAAAATADRSGCTAQLCKKARGCHGIACASYASPARRVHFVAVSLDASPLRASASDDSSAGQRTQNIPREPMRDSLDLPDPGLTHTESRTQAWAYSHYLELYWRKSK